MPPNAAGSQSIINFMKMLMFFKASPQDGRSVSTWTDGRTDGQTDRQADRETDRSGPSYVKNVPLGSKGNVLTTTFEGFFRLEPLISNQISNRPCLLPQSVTRSSQRYA